MHKHRFEILVRDMRQPERRRRLPEGIVEDGPTLVRGQRIMACACGEQTVVVYEEPETDAVAQAAEPDWLAAIRAKAQAEVAAARSDRERGRPGV